jgi:polar amino acid transport system substrate-binding protein
MRIIYLCLLAFFVSCSSGPKAPSAIYRIGIDPIWAPLDFGPQQAYVNGYTEDILLEVARINNIAFEKLSGDPSTLLDDLLKGKYDAVLSSLPPYEFNKGKYDFSKNFLNTGFVLVVASNTRYKKLSDLSGELVGVIADSPAVLLIEKNPDVIIRSYPAIPAVLDAIMNGEIEAAVLDRLPVAAYVRDLYSGKLQIITPPLTDSGLHAVAKKDAGPLIHLFNKATSKMEKKHTIDRLEKKWQLQ